MTRVHPWSPITWSQYRSHKRKTAPAPPVQFLRARQGGLGGLAAPEPSKRAALAAAAAAVAFAEELHRTATSSAYVPDFARLLALDPALTAAQWEQLLACPATSAHLLAVVTALKRAGGAVEPLIGPDGVHRIFLQAVKAVDTVRALQSVLAVVCNGRMPVARIGQLGAVAAATVTGKPTTHLFDWFLAQVEVQRNFTGVLDAMACVAVRRSTNAWLLCLWGAAMRAKALPQLGRAMGLAQRMGRVHPDMKSLVNQLLHRLVPDYGCCGLDTTRPVGTEACSTTVWLHVPFVFPDAPTAVLPFGQSYAPGAFDAVEDAEYAAAMSVGLTGPPEWPDMWADYARAWGPRRGPVENV